jgi:hypothetical protein
MQQAPAGTIGASEIGRKIVPSLAATVSREYDAADEAAAHVCSTATGRLFATDKSSELRFLIDTGSDLCVFPRKLIPQCRKRVNYDLCAVNGTTIPTYGWLPLRLNLGLCREFARCFVVANITQLLLEQTFCPTTASWWTAGITA